MRICLARCRLLALPKQRIFRESVDTGEETNCFVWSLSTIDEFGDVIEPKLTCRRLRHGTCEVIIEQAESRRGSARDSWPTAVPEPGVAPMSLPPLCMMTLPS